MSFAPIVRCSSHFASAALSSCFWSDSPTPAQKQLNTT
jgi:hypothetical protein